uniref:membrane protein insertase YidC n=1 Tax=Yoonia sp. TaxID=2212373 RepID=UPI0040480B01
MDDQNKNLILATALSFLVILTWFVLFPPDEPVVAPDAEATISASADATVPVVDGGTALTAPAPAAESDPAADAPRIAIQTRELSGTLSLLGGRIDDLSLTQYKETLDADAQTVRLLRPVGEADAYFATFGWAGVEGLDANAVPGPDTLWSVESGDVLTPDTPVTLVWD